MKKLLLTAATAAALALNAGAQENPEALYIIGSMNNWVLPTEEFIMYPDSTGLYTGTFWVEADQLEFKVYTVNETNWENPELYFGTNTVKPVYSNMDASMPMSHNLDYNFFCNNWQGGQVTITADLAEGILTISGPEQPEFYEAEEVYMVGAMNGWNTPDNWENFDNYVLHRDSTSSVSPMMYTGEFDIPADAMEFKLFTKRVGWNDGPYYMGAASGCKVFSNEPATMAVATTYVENISCTNWQGGKAILSLDLYNGVLTVEGPEQPIKPEAPEYIYLIGAPQGWKIDSNEMTLSPINGTDVFKGVFDIPEGSAMFRFYTQLGNWEEGSLGIGVDDEPIEVEFFDGYTSTFVNGKGSWNFTNWPGGAMEIILDYGNKTVSFSEAEELIYLVGSPQGWDIYSDAMPLAKVAGSKSTFTGTYHIDADPYFRFYTELGNWDLNSIGSQVDDMPVDIEFNSDMEFFGTATWGKGSWHLSAWNGGNITFVVDTDAMTVKFTGDPNEGVASAAADTFAIRKMGNSAVFGTEVRYTVVSTTGATVMSGYGDTANLANLAKGIYVVKAIDNSGNLRTAKIAR